ncbi:Uncharacterized protein Adt_00516 [Abeliophyllum distichum]|uniref:Retrotransposon gag domain-containing protein n=1 Tax=Abeliophyllum distichum TaxID=126358 RepID=A0ABD1NZ38_9LAMI
MEETFVPFRGIKNDLKGRLLCYKQDWSGGLRAGLVVNHDGDVAEDGRSASYIGGGVGSRSSSGSKCPTSCGDFPAVEILPSETAQTRELMPTSRHSIPVNWESILNDKVEEAIARRKSRVRPISIKEDPFTEDVMTAPLLPKFKEPTGEFDGTGDPIDHIRIFQDRVRLHGWSDVITCRAFSMTLRKDAKEWFDTLPPRSISSFADFVNKFAIYFSSSARKKKTAMGLMQVT